MRQCSSWIFALALGGCDAADDREPTVTPEPVSRVRGLDEVATKMLAQVPADTPYVWVNAEPLPQAYVDRVAPLVDATLAAWGRAMNRARPHADRETAAAIDAFAGKMSRKGLTELGFQTNPHVVVYGLGLAPVIRLELDDGNAVARLIERIDAADGNVEVQTIAGHPVWTSSSSRDSFGAAVAVVDDELVISVFPPSVHNEILPRIVGTAKPQRSLLQTDWLNVARRNHDLLTHGLAMVDLTRVLAILDGDGDALTRGVTRGWRMEQSDHECMPAARAWFARSPRIWFGLREIGPRGIEAATIWELDAGLQDDLRKIAAPMAGLGRDEGLASLAIGMHAGRALATWDRWRHDDRLRGCEIHEEDEVDWGLPRWLEGVYGGSAVLHDWDPRRDRGAGVMVLGVEDPQRWLETVMPVADTEALRRAGKVVPLAKVVGTAAGRWLEGAWISRGRSSLGIAAGDGARRDLRRAVGRERSHGHTLVSWSFDVQGLLDEIGDREVQDALAGSDSLERAAYEAMIDALGPVRGAIEVGDHGLEIVTEIGLSR